eukprot:symbB.v1.2.028700.t1/scaffold3068.1/size68108/6
MEPRDVRRSAERRRMSLAGALSLCGFCGFFGLAFVGMPSQPGLRSPLLCEEAAASLVTRHARGPKVNARRSVSPFYSNEDRERLARLRQEKREYAREFSQNSTWVREQTKMGNIPQADLTKLPALQDIYDRKFTGDADVDPIGGRKRPGSIALPHRGMNGHLGTREVSLLHYVQAACHSKCCCYEEDSCRLLVLLEEEDVLQRHQDHSKEKSCGQLPSYDFGV